MSTPQAQQDAIAIIGLAGRFPKAGDVEQFWHNLRNGVEGISFFSDDELEAAGISFPRNNPNYVKARGLLEKADHFDAAFFGINPKEAEIMDPQHRLFLESAWEALENAGYDPERTEALVGVFAGMSMNTYLLSNLATRPEILDLVGHYQVMLANDKDYLPTRVSYKLNLKGPSVSIQTACSTSLVAVCVACQNLLNFQCDMALAGGVSVTFPQLKGHLYQEGGIVSADGHCRAFDAKAQGTVPGEGIGLVVLKRAEEALADGDQIYAVIKGFGINNDGSLKVGYSAPSEDGQADVIAMAQAVAGFEPESIRYVVTHGTGTPLGDPIEIAGLTKAFRAGTNANNFCAVTSVKTNIGHLDAAAGIAGLINATLALHHKFIPPSLHFETPNPKIDFANSPFYVNCRPAEWKAGPTPRRAGVSSFGIGGTNAHVVLEEALNIEPSASSRPQQLVLLSARTAPALDAATANLAEHLKAKPELNLADAAYTLQTGRRAFSHRRMLVCRDTKDAAEALQTRDPKRVLARVSEEQNSPVVFMFPGQGVQHVKMGAELYRTEAVFREQIDACAEILQPQLGLDLRKVLYPADDKMDEAKAQLTETRLTQPAIFSVDYALARLWMSWGVQPQAMIGHSVGEFVAACLAGVFSLSDGLNLVAARGRLVQEQPAGAMLAVRLEKKEVEPLLNGKLSLAAVNSPSVCVVSGPSEDIASLQQQLRGRGVASQPLLTSHAFHSAMMDPVLRPLGELVGRITLKPPRFPYISNVSATWITEEQALNPDYWSQHMRQTVRFAEGIAELLKEPRHILLEVGPGQALSLLARQCPTGNGQPQIVSSLPMPQSRQTDSEVLLAALGQLWLAGATIDWAGFHHREKRRRVPLPTYPFERKRFWVEPGKPLLVQQSQSAAVNNGAMESARPSETPRTSIPVRRSAAAPPGRKESIAAMLQALLSELSGLSVRQMAHTITFMEMGFDSLFLTQASQAIEQRLGVRVAFADLLEKFSTLDLLAEHLDQTIPPDKDLTSPPEPKGAPVPVGPGAVRIGARGDLEGVLAVPLTEAQKELWYATLMGEKASCVFNESMALSLRGSLDLEAMRKAIQQLVDRHEALRTSISPVGDEQQIFPRVKIEVPLIDLSALEPSQREARFNALMAEAASEAFDLSKAPLLRCRVVRMDPEFHYLIFVIHHIICDGGSVLILVGELAEFYSAIREGLAMEPLSPVQFSEYARAHARSRGSAARLADEAYWLSEFAAAPPHLELPADRPRPPKLGFNAAREFKSIAPALWQDLKRLSAQNNCTLFTTMLAAYYVFLHRLSGQDDIVVGVPMAVREGIEKLVGHCVNFLPLRAHVAGNPRFTDFLGQVRKTFFDAFDHQNYTFGSLIQKLNLPRNSSRMPLLSATFNLARSRGELNLAGLKTKLVPNPKCFANFDITCDIIERDGQLDAVFTYNTDLYDRETVQRWLRHFHTFLEEIAAHPRQRVGELSVLSVAERNQVLVEWNQPGMQQARTQWLQQMLEAQPETAALRLDGAHVYILDAYQQPVPIGVAGELYLGGEIVARADLDASSFAPERLVPSPFSDSPATRLYRTGSWGRYRNGGQIEFLGQLEQQIQIGGYRIEPSRIETVLGQHPQVRQCVAASRKGDSGKLELVAFVVRNNGQPLGVSQLRDFLSEKLPEYLIPARFVFLDKLPLLPNGKVDRAQLPAQVEELIDAEIQEAPSMSATEKILADIWAEVIGLKEVGNHDNFFELGGHSVLVTQIIARVRKIFHVDLNLRTVFESPTIAALAGEIEAALIQQLEDLPENEAQQLSRTAELITEETR